MGFDNPILGGGGALVRPAVKSPNFLSGVSGWTIRRDGSAEFADLQVRSSDGSGRTLRLQNGHLYVYDADGTTLLAEISPNIVGSGGGGFVAYGLDFGTHYDASLSNGGLSIGSSDYPGLVYGGLSVSDLGGGPVFELMIQAPHLPGTSTPALNFYSGSAVGVADDELVLNASTSTILGDLVYGGRRQGSGNTGFIARQTNTAAVTAETVFLTSPAVTLVHGRAYEFEVKGLVSSSIAADRVQVRVKKTNTAGYAVIDSMAGLTVPAISANTPFDLSCVGVVSGGSDIGPVSFVATYARQAGTGNVLVTADASNPAYLRITDVGPASYFPTARALT